MSFIIKTDSFGIFSVPILFHGPSGKLIIMTRGGRGGVDVI